MKNYEINEDTLAIISNYPNTKIYEGNKSYLIKDNTLNIIKKSCEYFGSSYLGRHEGTKSLIGVSHKSPIIIEESREIIFFPTNSPRIYECAWISLKNLQNYKKGKDNTTIIFNNGHLLNLDISYGSLDNQVLRAARLESVLRLRKNNNFL